MARRARLPEESLRPYLLDVPHPRTPPELLRSQLDAGAPPFAWPAIFGNDHPVEIEVGFGKGLFLLNAARHRPDTNFLGIEIERKYVLLTAGHLARRQAVNVRLACTDAAWLLRARVAPASVQAIHVYFPDPWWKKRHHKRRLMTPEIAGLCAAALCPGGCLHFVSDVADAFAETSAMLERLAAFERRAWPEPAAAADESDYLTNFERKYRKEGRTVYRARFVRRDSSSVARGGDGAV